MNASSNIRADFEKPDVFEPGAVFFMDMRCGNGARQTPRECAALQRSAITTSGTTRKATCQVSARSTFREPRETVRATTTVKNRCLHNGPAGKDMADHGKARAEFAAADEMR